jgi:LacI family transcriptional regulator
MSSLEQSEHDHRIQVALAKLRILGVPDTDITILYCPHDRVAAHDRALEFLRAMPQSVAVYGGSDVSAIGVLWAAQRLGLDVPGQVGILGHGNTSETRITVPAITSLGPVSDDFSEAAHLIRSRLRDRSLPGRHIAEPYQLTVRQST